MYQIRALQLRNLDVFNGSFVHAEKDDTWKRCLALNSKRAEEVRIERFDVGACISMQVEDTQSGARQTIKFWRKPLDS